MYVELDRHRVHYMDPNISYTSHDETAREIRRRIQISVWAYAYECLDEPLVDDATWDEIARQINPKQKTGHILMDAFFRTEFSPHTGLWIHNHLDREALIPYYLAVKLHSNSPIISS